MTRTLILAASLGLAGCQHLGALDTPGEEEMARANATWTPNLPVMTIRVDDPHAVCVHAWGMQVGANRVIHGCSDPWGFKLPGFCAIVVPRDDPGWIEKHERRHCKYGRYH